MDNQMRDDMVEYLKLLLQHGIKGKTRDYLVRGWIMDYIAIELDVDNYFFYEQNFKFFKA